MNWLALVGGFLGGALTTTAIYVFGWREGHRVGRAEGRADSGRNVYD